MEREVRILEGAWAEVEEIMAYLSDQNSNSAIEFLAEFEDKMALIASGAVTFRLSRMPELAALGYRTVLIGNYVALYYEDGEVVVVAHVFHQRQDYAPLVVDRAARSEGAGRS